MTRNDDFIGQLVAYLEQHEGSTPLPDHVRDAIGAELPSTHQRPAWWPEQRTPSMNNYVRLGAAAAVLVIAAALGYNFLVAPNVGSPGLGDPTPTPTPTPIASPFDSQSPGAALEPGAYFTTFSGVRATFTVPAGWQRNVVPQVLWTPNSEARLAFGVIENINADPCQPDLGELDPPPGPSADDLASALAAIPGVDATTGGTELSGLAARYVQLDVPAEFGDCIPSGGEALLDGEGPLEPAVHQFWIVDAQGTRIVIHSVARPGASTTEEEELDAIVASIHIEAE